MKKQDLANLRPSALNLRQLSLVEWLLSAPVGSRRFLVNTGMHLKFCETGEPVADGRLSVTVTVGADYGPLAQELRDFFGGKVAVDPEPLASVGLLECFPSKARGAAAKVCFEDRVADIYIPGAWSIHSRCYEIAGPETAEWYNTKGRARREKLLAAAVAKVTAVTRRAVFGRPCPVGTAIPPELAAMLPGHYRFGLPSQTVLRPCAVATIVEETEKRFKVRDIVPINGNQVGWMGVRIKNDDFFDREYLLLDQVSDSEIARIKTLDAEYAEEVNAIAVSIYAEIVPILARMADRLKQKQVQHEDLFSETLRNLIASRDAGAGGA